MKPVLRMFLGSLTAAVLVTGAACSQDDASDPPGSASETSQPAREAESDDPSETSEQPTGVQIVFASIDPGPDADLRPSIERIDERIDSLGIPYESSVSDGKYVVDLPDDGHVDEVVDLATSPGVLAFRPVLSQIPGGVSANDGLGPITEPVALVASDSVVLAEYDDQGTERYRYSLGPVPGAENPDDPETVPLTGDAVASADAGFPAGGAQWAVNLTLHDGESGLAPFNLMAQQCFDQTTTCPTGQIAIVLDGVVLSAPRIQVPAFEADGIQISGLFTEAFAKQLARKIAYGSLDVTFEVESISTP